MNGELASGLYDLDGSHQAAFGQKPYPSPVKKNTPISPPEDKLNSEYYEMCLKEYKSEYDRLAQAAE